MKSQVKNVALPMEREERGGARCSRNSIEERNGSGEELRQRVRSGARERGGGGGGGGDRTTVACSS
jgi:hypothetical protein